MNTGIDKDGKSFSFSKFLHVRHLQYTCYRISYCFSFIMFVVD
jgi:hypothetical protein